MLFHKKITMDLITKYISKLGFKDELKQQPSEFGALFHYQTLLPKLLTNKSKVIPFLFFTSPQSLFMYHHIEWNKNELDYFIAIENDKSYIVKAKEKPDEKLPLKNEILVNEKGFEYGLNTEGYDDILSIPFTKDNLDNSYFYDFVLKKQKEIKHEVDTHLLNNLIALKKNISQFDTVANNINGLILKCLFVKYLEDRSILPNNSFVEILQKRNPELLHNKFNEISIINGDILKKTLHITEKHIEQLEYFFTRDYSQPVLFYPYQFDKIPIQLISNVYEEFLGATNKEEKKTKGIFYTRTFVVDFMLSHKVYPKIEKEQNITILDPACGSGVFLVQAFKRILDKPENTILSIDQKATLLKKQIFGVDIDENALQITAFSLYLTLLEGCKIKDIQNQIKIRKPILPTLIDSNLLKKNTITDNIEFDFTINITGEHIKLSKFDCIVANPPWKQLEKKEALKEADIKKTREEIDKNAIYINVNKYQISQAFLLKISELCNDNSEVAIIVNNSNFLNEGAVNFRKEILEKYRLTYFYELSDVAGILFKHTEHPCAVLILDKQNSENHKIQYITPKLTEFSRKLRVIYYSQKDIKEIKQADLKEEDILWRVFVNGNWKDYQLIKKIELKRDESIKTECLAGIKPTGSVPIGEVILKKKLDAKHLTRFIINLDKLEDFNINQKFDRGRVKNYSKIFKGARILIKRTPAPADKLKLVCAFTDKEIVFLDHIYLLRFENYDYSKYYNLILNSSLFGFYYNQISSQTNKGKKQSAIKTKEVEELPYINIPNKFKEQFDLYNSFDEIDFYQLDELVFNLYSLLEFEKEIIREFYQINVEKKNKFVDRTEIQTYVDKFREVYQLVIKDNLRLNASSVISTNIGTIVKFDVVYDHEFKAEVNFNDFDSRNVLKLVKEKQIQHEMLSGYINEDKVKIYDKKSFYIVKSNQFKDWTKRQAMEDANEEVHEMLKKLMQ